MNIQLLILSLYVLPFVITLIYCLIQSYRYKTGKDFLNEDNADFLASLFLMSLAPVFNWACATYIIVIIILSFLDNVFELPFNRPFNKVAKWMFGEEAINNDE